MAAVTCGELLGPRYRGADVRTRPGDPSPHARRPAARLVRRRADAAAAGPARPGHPHPAGHLAARLPRRHPRFGDAGGRPADPARADGPRRDPRPRRYGVRRRPARGRARRAGRRRRGTRPGPQPGAALGRGRRPARPQRAGRGRRHPHLRPGRVGHRADVRLRPVPGRGAGPRRSVSRRPATVTTTSRHWPCGSQTPLAWIRWWPRSTTRRGRSSGTSPRRARTAPSPPPSRAPRAARPTSCWPGACWSHGTARTCPSPARSRSACAAGTRRATAPTWCPSWPPPRATPPWSTAPQPARPSSWSGTSSCCSSTGAPLRPPRCGPVASASASSRPPPSCCTATSAPRPCTSRSRSPRTCWPPAPTGTATPCGCPPTRSTSGARHRSRTVGPGWRWPGSTRRGWPGWSAGGRPANRSTRSPRTWSGPGCPRPGAPRSARSTGSSRAPCSRPAPVSPRSSSGSPGCAPGALPPATEAVAWTVEESAVVGLTALGGMSAHGRALLSTDDPLHHAPSALAPLLPEPVDHVLLQADLTAVAPGPLEQDLARHLAMLADIESRGGATVYRFTERSVRRAFDSGWSAAEVHGFVASSSRTPVPQALTYLVDDVSRRFGTIRVGAAESFLRSDDETALTELVHHPQAASLRLRRIAPTVVVSDVPLDVLLPRLRELGSAPVVEAPDGTVRLARRETLRAHAPRRRQTTPDPVPLAGPLDAQAATRLAARAASTVTAVRAGDRAAEHRPAPALRASEPDHAGLHAGPAARGGGVPVDRMDGVPRQPRLLGRAGRGPGQGRGGLAVGVRPPHGGRPVVRRPPDHRSAAARVAGLIPSGISTARGSGAGAGRRAARTPGRASAGPGASPGRGRSRAR